MTKETEEYTPEQRLSAVHHFAGQRLLDARLSLEEGDADGAERARQRNIADLENLGGVDRYVDVLRKANWRTTEGVNAFDTEYRKMYAKEREAIGAGDIRGVVDILFGGRK